MALLLAAAIALQTPSPTINPASVYGLKTFATNPTFGIFPDGFQVGFPPATPEDLTMQVQKVGGSPIVSGGFYTSANNYPSFHVLRFAPVPTIEIPEPGKYTIEFRNKTQKVSEFPIELVRKATGDEFNPTVFWDYKTPVDKMGGIYFENTRPDASVYVMAWIAPRREGISATTPATVTLSHNGKDVAEGKGLTFHEFQNARRILRLNSTQKIGKFTQTDLRKLSGNVVLTIKAGPKVIRKFSWTITGGQFKLHPKSASDYSPRTGYYVPRFLAGSTEGFSNFTLCEFHWSDSSI